MDNNMVVQELAVPLVQVHWKALNLHSLRKLIQIRFYDTFKRQGRSYTQNLGRAFSLPDASYGPAIKSLHCTEKITL